MDCHSQKKKSCLVLTQRKLASSEHRMTGPRRALVDCLSRLPHPVTVKELHAAMGKTECDLATIYRSIRLLEKLGTVDRFDFGDGVARYEMVSPEGQGHHHHLICKTCSRVVELEDCLIAQVQNRIAQETGFKAVSHKLEFFGTCPECQHC